LGRGTKRGQTKQGLLTKLKGAKCSCRNGCLSFFFDSHLPADVGVDIAVTATLFVGREVCGLVFDLRASGVPLGVDPWQAATRCLKLPQLKYRGISRVDPTTSSMMSQAKKEGGSKHR